ncbi:hypothetical protein B0H17DRAFT_1331856 [Mycena rosella]|uniref:Uncharacterized protein n=1 Tax=Mycena rosella TaxID=1033263 RepID=A0AAD7DE32_MYCRO|nr:hypothetical protein B0H17DRAFT_1331856 [Mycena rosella]
MSSTSNQVPSGVMTSPVFRYAVLIVMCVVVIMAAGVCYRTRVYQRRMRHFAATHPGFQPAAAAARDWGPAPRLFDVYLQPPSEKRDAEWGDLMPISITRGGLDSSGASSTAHVSTMISMPFSQPHPVPDDERPLPHLEIGLSDVDARLADENAGRSSAESASNTK